MQRSLRVYPNNSGVVIIDFDNIFKKGIEEYSYLDIEFFLKNILKNAINEIRKLRYIEIRLYGGWYRGNILTQRGSILQQYLSLVKVFPVIESNELIIKGNIEIATSLIALPNLLFEDTLREKNGIPRVQIKNECMSEECSNNPTQCPIKILSKFTKSKSRSCGLNGCRVIHNEIIKGNEQKMVDTMMACDTLHLTYDHKIDGIFLASNDTDVIPPLIQSKTIKQEGEIYLILKENFFSPQYLNMLNQANVKIIQIS
jgi:uncharacterized LabA/DUF88 family protein